MWGGLGPGAGLGVTVGQRPAGTSKAYSGRRPAGAAWVEGRGCCRPGTAAHSEGVRGRGSTGVGEVPGAGSGLLGGSRPGVRTPRVNRQRRALREPEGDFFMTPGLKGPQEHRGSPQTVSSTHPPRQRDASAAEHPPHGRLRSLSRSWGSSAQRQERPRRKTGESCIPLQPLPGASSFKLGRPRRG